MEIRNTINFIELIPDEGMVLVNKEKTEKYEYSVILGCNDSIDNYTEVTLQESNLITNDREEVE